MANDLNVVALVGRLTRPCDMRYSANGFAICSFTLAINKNRRNADGTWSEQAHFIDCSYFGKAAEAVSQYLGKGQQVSIQGSLEQQHWETNGQKRSKIVVIVNSLTLVGSPSRNNGNNANYGGSQQMSRPNNGYNSQNNYSNQPQFGNTQTGFDNGFNSNRTSNASNTVAPASSVVNNEDNNPLPDLGPEDFDDNVPF